MAPSYEERMGQLLTNNEVSYGVWHGSSPSVGFYWPLVSVYIHNKFDMFLRV